MAKLKVLLLLLGCLYGHGILAQEGQYHSKWYFKISTGFSAPLNRYTPAGRSDFLLSYSDASQYLQVVSATFWLTRKWGLEFSHTAHTSRLIRRQYDAFKSSLEKEYGEQFFITPSSSLEYETGLLGGSFERIGLGAVYRIETPKFLLLPKIVYGGAMIQANWGEAILKEKDSNSLLTLNYRITSDPYATHPMISTGITGLYRLSKKFLLGLDVQYTRLKLDVAYEEELRNVFTEAVIMRPLVYKDALHSLTFGLGLIYEVRYFSRR